MRTIMPAAYGLLAWVLCAGWAVLAAEEKMDEAGAARVAAPGGPKFAMHRIGTFRSEACGVGDFNNDGKLDIVAGNFLYLAPDFKPLKIRTVKGSVDENGKGYHNDFMNAPLDVDGDGKLDVVSADWFSCSSTWFRNTLGQEGEWAEALVEKNGNFECGDLVDILGTGKAQRSTGVPPVDMGKMPMLQIVPHVRHTEWYEAGLGPDGKRTLLRHVISAKQLEWGAGVGDLNGDGRPDVIRPNAWFEASADPRTGEWKEHPLSLGDKNGKMAHTAQILVYDVNGDGLNDIICSNAHGYGIFWYEQVREGGEIRFKQHLIDDSWTQAHILALGDLDGDGAPELVTGKRFMAHNGSDPEENAPLGVYCYKIHRGPDHKVTWTKHIVSYNEGVGSGMNICLVDLDGDGDLDIVVTGKFGGPVWFENKLR